MTTPDPKEMEALLAELRPWLVKYGAKFRTSAGRCATPNLREAYGTKSDKFFAYVKRIDDLIGKPGKS